MMELRTKAIPSPVKFTFMIVKVLVKLAIVIALTYLCLDALNGKMAAFLDNERKAVFEGTNKHGLLDYHYEGQFNEMYEQQVGADIILIGTSHITHGVNPKYLEKPGRKFFNFALNGGAPSYYKAWYNNVFKKSNYPKPKAIIYGVEWFMFDDNWLWRRIEMDGKYMREVIPVEEIDVKWYDIDGMTTVLFNRIPLIYARDRMPEVFFPKKEEEKPAPQRIRDSNGNITTSYYNGYIPYEWPYNGTSSEQVLCGDNPKVYEDFISLLDQFKDEGIPVIFVMTPEYIAGRDAVQFDEKLAIIEEIAEKYDIPFLNYNVELYSGINEDSSNFSDWGHLNEKGSTLFSQQLAKDLEPYISGLFEE